MGIDKMASEYKTPLPAALAAMLETGINGVLSLDENSASRLQRLEDRVLELELKGIGILLYITATEDCFRVSTECEVEEVDTSISGTPAALFSLGMPEWSNNRAEVEINGNANLARDLEALFSKMEPDWGEPLSQVFGDVIGHQIGSALKQGADWAKNAASSTATTVADYLRDESGMTVTRKSLDEFLDGVDQLSDATDRLEARLRNLRQEPPK
jgi:ubiquinone biosynthesis protein UbiJ